MDSLPAKASLELIYTQNNVNFAIVLGSISFVCKLVGAVVLTSYDTEEVGHDCVTTCIGKVIWRFLY